MASRCAMSTALISYVCVSNDEDGSPGFLICKVFTTHPRRLKVIEMPSIKGGQSPEDKMTVGTPRHVIGGWDCYWSPFNWDLAGMPWRS